ncbi:MAG TPA: CsgE family curli-type amyloid fiber assembly protein [Castellaniella sp.]|uniref:CsgE family curli-type amyloid fiber assembly protein n=1 Tax=Castellaniella sp. TaxID=1955812 RepID=UPI002F025109
MFSSLLRPRLVESSTPREAPTPLSQRHPLHALAWLGITLMLATITAFAQDAPTAAQPPKNKNLDSGNINNAPLGGIIINRTMTVLGWDFYSNFSEIWLALHPDSPYMLTITERPTAQFGSEIWVDYRDIHIFHTFLSPARSGVKEASQNAVNIAYQNIQRIEQARKELKNDVDLGPEEM